MRNRSKFSFLLAALVLPITGPGTLGAAEFQHKSRFSVKFAGIEIGKAELHIKFDDVSYQLTGSGRTSGLASWASSASGTIESVGDLGESNIKPKIHKASLKESNKKTETVKLGFRGDKVTEIEFKTIKPRKKRKAPRYIPLQAEHMIGVLDPASPLILPLSGKDARYGRKVCNQIFPVFDGETRFDMKLSYKSTKPIKTEGYDGHAYVCKLRYVPIAGHKKDHRAIKDMAKNKDMEIWLAPMQGVSVFSPVRIRVGTKYGRFEAVPEYFGGAG